MLPNQKERPPVIPAAFRRVAGDSGLHQNPYRGIRGRSSEWHHPQPDHNSKSERLKMKTTAFTGAILCLLQLSLSDAYAQDAADPTPEKEQSAEKPIPQKSQEDLEKEFASALSNCELVGKFTVEGKANNGDQKPDRYLIAQARKVQGDHWTFVYVHKGIPIPLVLRVLWAGNTPIMTLDEFTIAGMGTFSARVMFDLNTDLYAGTWQHGDVGGLMFGGLVRSDRPEQAAASVLKKLDSKVSVSFNRTPIQEAFDQISKESGVRIVVDADGLKHEGYTRNMPQTFDLEDSGMAAIRKIVKRYPGMCLVLEDDGKAVRVTTKDYAEARKQVVLGLGGVVEKQAQ